MRRTVNKTKLNKWLVVNGPNAEAKIAYLSGLSTTTIQRMKAGDPPKKDSSLHKIAVVIDTSVDELFPQIATESCQIDNHKSGKDLEHGTSN